MGLNLLWHYKLQYLRINNKSYCSKDFYEINFLQNCTVLEYLKQEKNNFHKHFVCLQHF